MIPERRRTYRSSPWHSEILRWLVIIFIPALTVFIISQLLIYKPDFYLRQLKIGTNEEISRLAGALVSRTSSVQNQPDKDGNFFLPIKDRELNACLVEVYPEMADGKKSSVKQPRFAFDNQLVQVGFEFQKGPFSTIINLSCKVWFPQPNRLVIEIVSARAGAMPLPISYVRRIFENFLDDMNIDVEWKQNRGNLVGVIQLNVDRLIFRKVQVVDNQLQIIGTTQLRRSDDFAPSAN